MALLKSGGTSGHLVRTLEERLGAPLFHRHAGGRARLTPTDLAEWALPDIRAGFDRISLGLSRLKEGASLGILTVTVSPAFAAKWLLPRIDRFHHECADVDVRLDTSLRLLDFAAQGIDIGVRYGRGEWPGLIAEKLMDEEIYPVCSPEFQRKHRLKKPADLEGQTLIHDLSVDSHVGFATWNAWLRHTNTKNVSSKRGMRINNSAAVLQAAIDGQGVALARSVMARDDLASRRLVRLFPKVDFPSELAYYVVYRSESATLPRILKFHDWLKKEAGSPVSV